MRLKPVLFIAGVALAVALVLHFNIGSRPLIRAGARAPAFNVATQDGKRVSLDDFKGSVVFLNFWRTDCVPCAEEMPDMEAVARRFQGRKFQMMPVSLDVDPGAVAEFYRSHGFTMPAYLDPGSRAAEKYQITGTPETFVISPEGVVIRYYFGPQKWASPGMLALFDKIVP